MRRPKKSLAPLPHLNGIPDADVLSGHKDIHVRVTKEQFVRCKVRLFRHGISMGRLVTWLIKEVADENPHALKLVDGLVRHELDKQMGALREDVKKSKERWYDDIEMTTLYDMIERATLEDKDGADSEDDQ